MSATPHILLVEDNPGDVHLVEIAFERGGIPHILDVVTDGEEALERLRQRGRHVGARRPSLILMDINMSGRSGFDVLKEVKADPSLRRIPVCIFTSSSAEADIACAYELHANCYVTKPADFKALQKVIDGLGHFWFDTARLPEADHAAEPRRP